MDLAAMDTPTGIIEVGVDDGALVSLQFVDRSSARLHELADDIAEDPSGIRARLRAYYAGDLDVLAEIPVRFDRGTAFQRAVWRALQGIPVGETISYAELARRVGRPSAFRAVGSANGQNPVAVVVPCHRVIAADGTLGGYGGGLDRKRWLLAHEGAMAPQTVLAYEQGV
jgi:methylated-DNA-[protein]-cysteine S-methyltransferase